jgi:hypothetical protein
MVAYAERPPLVLDLAPVSTAGLGRLNAELEAARVRVRRRLRSAPTDGDLAVAQAIGWFQDLVEREAERRDRAVREAARAAG